ncbi:TorA maturation chaperone TorD [Orbus hercynius]|uniref:TorA maturation chaperone TorD n=1 Tax=Orbus hercynius TaxID=593135 RepID=A0A495RJ66_9GAMM|nr:Tat proofreading chaperone DmsD [Orbus hercynius]RKS87582.1 TorA maturation chaperone TorD [Orbus hercynius]
MSLDINTLNLPARLLGAFFYYTPDSAVTTDLKPALEQIDSLFAWSNLATIDLLCKRLKDNVNDPELGYQYSVLFEGQGFMPAPPWGSVYLDKENLLMGESTLRYRQFLHQHHIAIQTGMNEPEDQFGLMLMALALLIEGEQIAAAKTLISDHIMTWAPRYLELLSQTDISPFYQALAIIANEYLSHLVTEFGLIIPKHYLYK